jgi:hypothetical protein
MFSQTQIDMDKYLNPTLSVVIAFGLPVVLTYYHGIFKWLDFVIRTVLAEVNRYSNKSRLAARKPDQVKDIAQTVISIVGYREDPEVYEQALRSLSNAGAAILIAGIDGDSKEDMSMVDVCNEV